MESRSAVIRSSARKEKAHKKWKTNEGKDIISKLPESLITRILSFLPFKDAVRTCVLSKGWICHWTSITKLELHDCALIAFYYSPKKKTCGKQHFINLVNRALLLTKGSSVESFSLVMANKYDVSLINTWITNILNRRVKNLHIRTNSELTFSPLTSHSLFKSCFLEELVLQMSSCAIKIPPNCYVYFGDLKVLKLRGIIFTIDSPRSFNLPVLKKYKTENCSWLGAHEVTVKAPLLEKVVIIKQDFASVSHEPLSCRIKFSALHLKEFTYRGYGISQPIVLSDPSSARNASANIILYQRENSVSETAPCAFLLLKQFSQVKYIKFDGSKVLTQPNVAVLPVFAMLSHLELLLATGEVLLGLLQNSPVLKTLVLKGLSKFDEELLNSPIVPECLTSTLEIVRFETVNGCEHELYLAKFIMENGIVLERMSFSLARRCLWPSNSKVMEEFKEKLFSYKKGFSSFAIVEFSYDHDY